MDAAGDPRYPLRLGSYPRQRSARGKTKTKHVETFRHADTGRATNPTAAMQSFAEDGPRVRA